MKLATWATRMPWTIAAVTALLIGLGWLGIARAEELAGGGGRFLRQQIVWSVLALVAMLLATLPSYRVLCRYSYVVLAVSLVLLVAVYFFPAVNGSRRWIRLGPVGFQPSEFAKVAYVLALARWLMYRDTQRTLRGLLAPLALTLVPVVLILREPDLGTATVFLPVLLLMLFASGARRGDLAVLCLAGLVVLPLLWTQMNREQKSRVTALWEDTSPGDKPSDDAYHLYQSKQMLAVGAFSGTALRGEEDDRPVDEYVPAAHTDSIFSVLGERYGMLGTGAVLLLFLFLFWRGAAVATSTREPYGRLVVIGVVSLLAVQVLVNTSMLVGLLPITGLSLPLVSYGGSGLLAHALAVGLVLNVALRPGYEVTREPFRFAAE